MTLDAAAISRAVASVEAALDDLEKELNAADARLGDGDTGTMLARVVRALAKLDLRGMENASAAFAGMGKAAAMATGSSLGTLIATGLMTIGRETKGAETMDLSVFTDALAKAQEAMIVRGGASLGDKTVLDSLDRVVAAFRAMEEGCSAQSVAADAAEAALAEFRERPNRVGRARVYREKSVGLDDPGMLAVARVARTIAEG